MPASTYTGNNVVSTLARGAAMPVPTRVFISLHTADPGRAGANEVTLGAMPAYMRQDAAKGGAVGTGFTVAANRQTTNALQLLYPVHDGAANLTVSHFALWDAQTGGNCLCYGQFTNSRTVQPGDIYVIDPQKLVITQD